MSILDRLMLDRAALAGLRGFGAVEPNPMVGCALGREDGALLALGHHRQFGGPHAEIDALERCRALGRDPKGATCWVTLEPCAHHGKTPPCTDALIEAGVARVVYARADPGEVSGGGAAALEAAGACVEMSRESALAGALAMPFIKRARTGLPWITAKWAQTIDAKVAWSASDTTWISNATSRRDVHRRRGMATAILSAIGTILADDPRLTVRNVPARRTPIRIVIDPRAQTPIDGALMRTIGSAPIVIATLEGSSSNAARLRSAGATVIASPADGEGEIDLRGLLALLSRTHEIFTVYCEAGPGLLNRLLAKDLVDEAHVYVAPRASEADADSSSLDAPALDDAADPSHWVLWRERERHGDRHKRYLRATHLEGHTDSRSRSASS